MKVTFCDANFYLMTSQTDSASKSHVCFMTFSVTKRNVTYATTIRQMSNRCRLEFKEIQFIFRVAQSRRSLTQALLAHYKGISSTLS